MIFFDLIKRLVQRYVTISRMSKDKHIGNQPVLLGTGTILMRIWNKAVVRTQKFRGVTDHSVAYFANL